jgi:hypothetical protein
MSKTETRIGLVICIAGALSPLALASCTPIAPHAEYIHNVAHATKAGDERCAHRAQNNVDELRKCAAIRAALKAELVKLEGASDGGL